MTLILNGTDNSATTPAVTGTDTDTGVYYPAANQVALATNGALALLVDVNQRVGIGTTSLGARLNVTATSGSLATFTQTGATGYGLGIVPGADTTYEAFFINNAANTLNQIKMYGNGSASFAGNLSIGGAALTTSGTGITFPATQSASTNANTLDDYEEGTFTPALTAGTTNPTVTYVVQSGNYTKVGRVVSISARLQISAISGGSGAIRISGLPFANAMGICGAHASWISTLTLPVGTTWADTYFEGNDLHICIAASGTTAGAQQLSIGAVGASFDSSIQFTYQTS